ncbi:MAG: U32 family peptidase, partial [Planctomycetes bacterium]|nr:U32 family peptidase [Planctomycetota bacterium]
MTTSEDIQGLTRRVELLAPAGHREAFQAVLDAGADAVYLSTKQFNMRMHRRDFHFSLDGLADAIEMAHARRRRVYVTVNALIGERELGEVRILLRQVADVRADAVIVQDLATVRLGREFVPELPLHASTMMNVHHAEQAVVLKSLGIARIIASRDITLHQMGEIGRLAGIEVECFVHGDMCVAQSGQCTMSGVLFGKSSNRGQCMKPCRWRYQLVRMDDGDALGAVSEGHLMAIKDLALIRHLPEVIQAGICSLKIEGRMRDAAYLHHLVKTYRQALDTYYECPSAYSLNSQLMEQAYRQRVRPLSTLTMLGHGSHRDCFDPSGCREPLVLGDGFREPDLAEQADSFRDRFPAQTTVGQRVELAVSVDGESGARAALDNGADRIYIAAERTQYGGAVWPLPRMIAVMDDAHQRGVRVGLCTPRITLAREWAETAWMLEQTQSRLDMVLVHHLGTLALARRRCPGATLIADHGFNLLNRAGLSLLAELGAGEAVLSHEAGFADICELAMDPPMPLEMHAHGPIAGMLMDHCLIAMYASPLGRKDVCRGLCRHVQFGLRDRTGQLRPVVADQHCRNHLLMGHDVGTLPVLDRLLCPGIRSIRIDGQFYAADQVAAATRAYRLRLDLLYRGEMNGVDWCRAWDDLVAASPRPLN